MWNDETDVEQGNFKKWTEKSLSFLTGVKIAQKRFKIEKHIREEE